MKSEASQTSWFSVVILTVFAALVLWLALRAGGPTSPDMPGVLAPPPPVIGAAPTAPAVVTPPPVAPSAPATGVPDGAPVPDAAASTPAAGTPTGGATVTTPTAPTTEATAPAAGGDWK